MSDDASYAGELDFVKGLAQEAAAVAIARAKQVTPMEKANLTFVTDLDQDLEQFLRRRLGERYPDDRLTGEEYEAAGGTGPRRWSIDPIDGTGNLVHGLPLWAISIGLIADGVPVLGVIAVPPLGELYWAVKGKGAFLDGRTLRARDASTIHNQDNICLGTNALRAVDTRTFPGRIRDLGSACCEQVFVAANRMQACTFLGEALHDVAAGVVISSEAGCVFGTIDGERLEPGEMVRRTPVAVPTFVAPPQRMAELQRLARRLPLAPEGGRP